MGFEYFEHRAIGNSAYAIASLRLAAEPLALLAAAEKILGISSTKPPATDSGPKYNEPQFDFGDLAAIAGDHTRTSEELERLLTSDRASAYARQLSAAAARQHDAACRWLYQTYRKNSNPEGDCFQPLAAGEGVAPRSAQYAVLGYEPTRHERAEFESLWRYVELASDNRDHFPLHSWKAYSNYHELALRLAACAASRVACTDPQFATYDPALMLAKALVNEAMAQHFLQDSFASGHIGTEFGSCLWGFLCNPPKIQIQHTHDTLNQIGLAVYILEAPTFLSNSNARLEWTAFGDRHYFVPEAAFHRWVTTKVASESLWEVLAASAGVSVSCQRCAAKAFPLPPQSQAAHQGKDLASIVSGEKSVPNQSLVLFSRERGNAQPRSADPRVFDIPVEGWKISVGSGSSLRNNQRALFWPVAVNRGLLARLDYVRSTQATYPNIFGLEYWNIPNSGDTWAYTMGYMWPRQISQVSYALRSRLSYTIESQVGSSPKTRSTMLTLPSVELLYEVYRPLALFVTYDLAAYDFSYKRAVWYGQRRSRTSIGLRFDLSGVN